MRALSPGRAASVGLHHLLILCTVIACEPTSATDKDAHREELRRTLDVNRFWGEYELLNKEVDRRFAARFEGKVQPGVGCQVCPALCVIADLRPIEASEFKARFREAAAFAYSDVHYRDQLLATREMQRLGCIAGSGGEALRTALRELLAPTEDRATRYEAAEKALAFDIAVDDSRRVLSELSGTQ